MLVAIMTLVGCEEDAIRSYTVPADAPLPPITATVPPMDATATGGAMSAAPDPGGAPTSAIDLHWTVPPSWRESATKQSFTVAAYEAGPTDAPVPITVTRLTGEGGGALGNVNRWRGQIGLPPVAQLHDQPMQRIDIGPGGVMVAGFVDLVGETTAEASQPTRIVGAILPRAEQNETWFFKMTGPAEALEPLKPQLAAMIESIHVHGPGQSHHHGELPAPSPSVGEGVEAAP